MRRRIFIRKYIFDNRNNIIIIIHLMCSQNIIIHIYRVGRRNAFTFTRVYLTKKLEERKRSVAVYKSLHV